MLECCNFNLKSEINEVSEAETNIWELLEIL